MPFYETLKGRNIILNCVSFSLSVLSSPFSFSHECDPRFFTEHYKDETFKRRMVKTDISNFKYFKKINSFAIYQKHNLFGIQRFSH